MNLSFFGLIINKISGFNTMFSNFNDDNKYYFFKKTAI